MIRQEKLVLLLATWFGVGYLPKRPGTWGSLAALPLWWLLQHLNPLHYFSAVLLVAAGGIFLSDRAEILLQQHDSPVIVIDEVTGLLIALAGCPANFFPVLLGVILFRIFDIFKPGPIGYINDHINGGVGVVLDDVLAGIFAGIILVISLRWVSI